jgi:hypothetical protein
MEVRHSHHPTHKKKWHEYMLEFLMLFLAVFLGFLVENFREHQVEVHRTRQHMHTMVGNLQFDTTRFGSVWRLNLRTAKGLDSFRYQIREAMQGRVDGNGLYYFMWRYGRTFNYAVTNSSAMTQLKSSGMLRMIKNDSLVAKMAEYYERTYTRLDFDRETAFKRRETTFETYNLFFSFIGFDELIARDTIYSAEGDPFRIRYAAGLLSRDPPLQLLSDDRKLLEKLYTDVAILEMTIRSYVGRLRFSYAAATDLIAAIKNEYHFD